MNNKKMVPKIRFNNFNDEWVKQDLESEITEIFAGGDIDKKKILSKGMYPVIANALTNNGIIGYYNEYFRIKAPAVTVTGRGNVGHANARKINFTPVVRLLTIKTSHDVDFLEKAINNHKVIVESTGIPQLTIPQLLKYKIFFPKSIEEEEKLGVFFRNIDELLILFEKEYDKLITLKKAMFEKMFPKDGKDIPEVRFKGFTESWMQCNLGKVLTERKVLQKISEDAPILAFAAGQGVIDRSERKSNNRDHLTLDPTNKTYLLTEYNDIVYNPSNLKYGAIDRNKHGRGVISPIYVTFTTEEEPSFIELIVKSEKFKLRALQYEEGTVVKRQSVKPENLLSLSVKISKSKDEQKKIGEYFEKMDKLILLHQKELEKLKIIKKACLQKMFI